MNQIVEIEDLTCRYGPTEAVRHLNLTVPEGSVYAFLGTNGAGKTTTIKTLLNLLPPSEGTARVLGIPVGALGPGELAQIGYVSEDQALPQGLTVRQLINFSRALYPTWDDALGQRLLEILALSLDRKVMQFSRGMKIKAALLLALAYRPRLLILDEPFSGLDPLVRDELIQAMIEIFDQEKWTMFISSHDIDEVERLADWVGIIDGGNLRLSEPVETLRSRFRRIVITLPEGEATKERLPEDGLLPETMGGSARWIDSHFESEESTREQIRKRFPEGTKFNVSALSLREIFVAVTRTLRQPSQEVL